MVGYQFVQVKYNLQLFEFDLVVCVIGLIIFDVFGCNSIFFFVVLLCCIFLLLFNCYQLGQMFGFYVDNVVCYDYSVVGQLQLVCIDLLVILFLSDLDEYEGGELVIEDIYGNQWVKLLVGYMVFYFGISLYQVILVIVGVWLVFFFWIQSMLCDDGQCCLMWDLDVFICCFIYDYFEYFVLVNFIGVYYNLFWQWVDV